ncbi:MAG: prephenate dehydratase [Candidatus Lokiarchaeota archaeon]|nr:prephenate dehydratase [Candidatus Lokiarchaeota archaeon]
MEEIEELRTKINKIDKSIVDLIEKRAKIAKSIGELKQKLNLGIYQPGREKEVIDHIKEEIKSIPPESVEAIWVEIMSACKVVQGKKSRVCFLGPEGTFTEIAAKKFFPKAGSIFVAVPNKKAVFNKVEGNYADFGIVPIENSLEGSVRETLDLLIEYNLKIYGEVEIRIVHNLIAKKDAKLSDIKTIVSHPQALAQCNRWLLSNLPNAELINTSSTARAVEMVAENKKKDMAAIGTKEAAKIHKLECIASGIEDNTQNYTRFFVISKNENIPTDNDKTTMIFVTKHVPGALFSVIKIFAESDINLIKIESRPRKKDLWEYIFIIEFEGNYKDLEKTLKKVEQHTVFMKILGSYPKSSKRKFK